jgi:8-oxo-dGTP diphosphatase
MGLLLFILANLIALVLFPIGFVYGLFRAVYKKRAAFRKADAKMLALAKAVDKYGNVMCGELFNDLLIKKESRHLFGRIEQTISMVIGYNQLAGTLSKTGHFLNAILNRIDPNHSVDAITEDKTQAL